MFCLKMSQQGRREVLEPKLAIRGVCVSQECFCLSVLGGLGHWAGATQEGYGLSADGVMDFQVRWLGPLTAYVPAVRDW